MTEFTITGLSLKPIVRTGDKLPHHGLEIEIVGPMADANGPTGEVVAKVVTEDVPQSGMCFILTGVEWEA